jgi:3-hydroxybutyryl-CoA dehydrogenase
MVSIKTVGVIGAGVMGTDVALDLALNSFNVILKDIDEQELLLSRDRMKSELRMVKMLKKNITTTLEEVFKKILFTTNYDCFKDIDLIIENVDELFETKFKVYKELSEVCRPDTIYAANTSCISITKISSFLKFPDKLIGVHFMNPVPLKMVVETIRGFHTSKDVEETIVDFLRHMGKNAIVVNDFPGFVANRISHLFMNEAICVIQDNVASPKQVDIIFKQGYGHTIGPLETADLIGLDTVLNSLKILYDSYKDPKFRPCPLLEKMVDAGLLGRKSGQGFFKY